MPRTGIILYCAFAALGLLALNACAATPPQIQTVVVTEVVTAPPPTPSSASTTVAQAATATLPPGETPPPSSTITTTPLPSTGTATQVACVPGSQYIADVTIPDGTVLAPGAAFVKTWRVKNSGSCAWDNSYSVVYVSGAAFANSAAPVPNAAPGAVVDISLPMTAPAAPGSYSGLWQLRGPGGTLFGSFLSTVLAVPTPTAAATPVPTMPPLPDITQIEGDGAVSEIDSPGYAPNGSYPPATRSLVFRVKAYDPKVGKKDGAGIKSVDFDIIDHNGNQVYPPPNDPPHTERTPAYCAFGGDQSCDFYVFSQHNNQWPDGTSIANGTYTLEVQVNTDRGNQLNGSLDFQIQISQ